MSFGLDSRMMYYGDTENDVINSPDLIDGEYYSDLLAYEPTLNNHFYFVNAQNAYDVSVGSLNSKRFSIQQRIKVEHAVNDKMSLRLRYFEREDFEIARQELMAGLGYQINNILKLSVQTSLFSEKSNNDLGVAADIKTSDSDSLQVFANIPDFSFNARNESESENTKQTVNYGLSYRRNISNVSDLEFFILQNTDLKRKETPLQTIYEFSELRTGVNLKSRVQEFDVYLRSEIFDGDEGRYDLNAVRSVWERTGLRLNSRLGWRKLLFGIEYNWRKWSLNSRNVFHRNIMPHMWYSQNFNGVMSKIDFGLETSFHDATGDVDLRKGSDRNSDVNGRFNMRLHFKFSPKAFLNLLFSLDLDDGSWEGGGGQFQALF